MPNFLSRLKVRTPKYNIFPLDTVKNKLNMRIGRNYPVKYYVLHPGEEIDINMRQLTRFMPLQNPIFHKVDLEFIPFFVPFRLLDEFGFKASDYFNPATPDSDRPAMPMISVQKLYSGIDGILGSIWDYLRYPTYSYLLRILQNQKNTFYTVSASDSEDEGVYTYASIVSLNPVVGSPVGFKVTSPSDKYNFSVDVYGFFAYALRDFWVAGGRTIEEFETYFPKDAHWTSVDLGSEIWNKIYEATGLRVDQMMQRYLRYLHQSLYNAFVVVWDTPEVSLLPWLCYSRLIYDWFINTNLTDISNVPSLFSNVLGQIFAGESFSVAISELSDINTNFDLSYFFPYSTNDSGTSYVGRVAFTLWQRDYFTGALPNSQSGDAVPIPANGTIPDLTGARKLQWFRTLNIFGGKRWIDQIWTHRGVRSSDARMDRTEVIGEKKVWSLQISDVLQTSQSTIDSSQGDFAGHGISYGGDHLCHYRAEEDGMVFVICRVRPKNSYLEAVPKLIFKSDFYDFEQPEFDNVGMQPIMFNELQTGSAADSNRVFGWTRRYADYITDFDEYHGDMQTSLVNWHMARLFDNGHPLLNTPFSVVKSSGSDDLNRIFSNPGYGFNVLAELTFDTAVSRPISKVIEFDF